jgi:Flp pilus assembly protein TadB
LRLRFHPGQSGDRLWQLFSGSRAGAAASLEDRAQALRSLAAILRSGCNARQALIVWHSDVTASGAGRLVPSGRARAGVAGSEGPSRLTPALSADLSHALTRLSRRLRLGQQIDDALRVLHCSLEEDTDPLRAAFAIHARLGGNVAEMVDRLASSIEERHRSRAWGRAAAAGAKMSSRLVAGLPLALLFLMPTAHVRLFDPLGLILLVAGVGLATTGIVWISKLVPRPPQADDAAAVADIAAGVLAGGAALAPILEALAENGPLRLRASLSRAVRLKHLGLSWPQALARSGEEGLGALGPTVGRAHDLGIPIAMALSRFSVWRRTEQAQQFDAQLKRAPVAMVLPLTLCVLPSFALLGLAPFLRGLSLH